MDCVLCDIIEGAEASRVYEDELCLAIMDLYPVTTGHLLVTPKRHAPHIADLSGEEATAMFQIGTRLAAALRHSTLRCEGVNLFLADGEAAFQEVFHSHLHVFPRYQGDTFKINADWLRQPREELDAAAEAIRLGLSSLE
jgi:diadenosine tetraphosphate (Ap4A) HIT family hydrolase